MCASVSKRRTEGGRDRERATRDMSVRMPKSTVETGNAGLGHCCNSRIHTITAGHCSAPREANDAIVLWIQGKSRSHLGMLMPTE